MATVLNPDQLGVAHPSATNTHALFVGGSFTAAFPETFGLPRLHLAGG